MSASQNGHADVVRLLLDARASVDMANVVMRIEWVACGRRCGRIEPCLAEGTAMWDDKVCVAVYRK